MKSVLFKSAPFAIVLVAALSVIVAQRQARAALDREGEDLRRRNANLSQTRVENQRLVAAVAAAAPPAPAPAPATVAPVPPVADPRDPTQGMVPTEHLQPAGHATPADAFQTLVWAALNGDEALLAGSLWMSESARLKLAGVLARLDGNLRKKFTVPESIPALLLAEEILKKILQLHLVSVEATGDDTAKLQTKITSRVGRVASQSFSMQRVNGKWALAIEDEMVDSMIDSLSRKRP